MRVNRFLAAAAALVVAVLPARADQILDAGRVDNAGNLMLPGAGAIEPRAPTNAALKAISILRGRIQRDGFYAAGDGGAMDYTWSASNCSAPDDGAQVQPTGRTGCWIAELPARLRPEAFGSKSDGTFDDGPAVRAACTAAGIAGKVVYLSVPKYYLF